MRNLIAPTEDHIAETFKNYEKNIQEVKQQMG